MKIELLENTVCDGKVCEKGQAVEASKKAAKFLIATKKAKESKAKESKAKESKAKESETEKPVKRTYKKRVKAE